MCNNLTRNALKIKNKTTHFIVRWRRVASTAYDLRKAPGRRDPHRDAKFHTNGGQHLEVASRQIQLPRRRAPRRRVRHGQRDVPSQQVDGVVRLTVIVHDGVDLRTQRLEPLARVDERGDALLCTSSFDLL